MLVFSPMDWSLHNPLLKHLECSLDWNFHEEVLDVEGHQSVLQCCQRPLYPTKAVEFFTM